MSQTSDFLFGHTVTDIKFLNRELFIYLDNGGIYSIRPVIDDDQAQLNFQIIRPPLPVYAKAETAKLNKK